MSATLSALIPELQAAARDLRDAAGAAGLQPRITSTLRTHAEQTRLYRRYLAGLQPLPVAPPGTSAHEFGYAFDMVVSPMDALADVGATWQEWGGIWGGAFNDPVHFEYPGFKQPVETSTGYKVATTIASLAVPIRISTGITVSMWLQKHPAMQQAVADIIGFPMLSAIWNWELDALPQWLKDVLSF